MRASYLTVSVLSIAGATSIAAQGVTTPSAATTRVVTWGQATAGADRILRDGLVVAILTADSVAVAVSVVRTDDRLWANVSVANESGRRLDVDPAMFTLDVTDPREKRLRYLEPEDIARSIRNRAGWGALLATIAGDLATTETETEAETNVRATARDNEGYRISGTARSTTTSTTRTRDEQARAEAAADAERMTVTAASRAADVVNRALRANTLMPGDQIGGAVFFERDRRARQVLLRVPIGEIVFEFPYSLR